jgi:hypothetical protein
MTVILDAGALIALERNDRSMWVRLKGAMIANATPVTHGGVVAQVWRGGSGKQTLLAKAFQSVLVVPLDEELGRRAGMLLGRTTGSDAVDAAVVALATHGDVIVTSDPDDLAQLVEASPFRIDIVEV